MRLSSEVNQYVSDTAPWALVKTDRDRAGTVLYVALRAVDSLKVIFTPFLPHTSQTLHELLGYEGWLAGPLEFREVDEDDGRSHQVLTGDYASWVGSVGAERAPARAAAARAAAALPQARPVDSARTSSARHDRHACAPRPAGGAGGARAGARRRASTRVVTVATTLAGAREALELAARHDGVFAALGIHPHNAGGDGRASGSTSCASCSRTTGRSPSARPASTTSATTRRATPSGGCSRRSSSSPTELGKPVVIHTRAADEDTLAVLAGFDGTVVLHCFSSPALLEPALERGWYVSFAGNVTYPKAPELREAARARARRPAPRRDRQPVPRAAARARPPQRARVRHAHARRARRRRAARTPASSSAQIDANATAAFGL